MKFFKFLPLFLLLGIFLNSCQNSINGPENQFVKIYFKYGHKDILNTFNNTYQKDLVLDGTITVNFWLTADEQNKILNKANEINFFSLPDSIGPDSYLPIPAEDFGPQKLRIQYNGEDNTVALYYPVDGNDSQISALIELNHLIKSIIEAKPEFKRLPMGRGGYW